MSSFVVGTGPDRATRTREAVGNLSALCALGPRAGRPGSPRARGDLAAAARVGAGV